MVLRPRIVFLIDRYQGENQENLKKIISNINLSCLRILCYYKHILCSRGVKSSILWGYKFFDSVKLQRYHHRYKQCQFLDYATSHFDKFENELFDGICDETLSDGNEKPGEKLKVALTEIITDFQWDRPELFSPGKKGGNNDIEYNNLLFLFTNCPSGFIEPTAYFGEDFREKNFIECLFPKVLYKKFVKHLKIKLCWIDTGVCLSNSIVNENYHDKMEDGLKSINGGFVEMRYFASWWVYTGMNNHHSYRDMVNVSSLSKGLIETPFNNRDICITKCALAHDSSNRNTIIISLCPIHPSIKSNLGCGQCGKEEINSIVISDSVDIKSMSMNMLDGDNGYFFSLDPTLSENNKTFMVKLNESCSSKKALLIKFNPPNDDSEQVLDGIMVPYTSFFGTIIPFSFPRLCIYDGAIFFRKPEEEVIDEIADEIGAQFHKCFGEMNQDFGTSLVNSVDPWFLSNPNLGCPLEIKNMLCNLCGDRIAKQKKRDVNSKVLVEDMKEFYSSKRDNQSKTKSQKVLHSIALGKQRLRQHRKRLKDEENNLKVRDQHCNAIIDENSISSVCSESSVKLQSKDSLNDIVLLEYEALLQKSLSPTNMLKMVIQFYKSAELDSYKESSFSFLNSTILSNVEDTRDKNLDTPKEELVKEYLLQVHLYLECVHQLCLSDTEPILKKIVSFLRTVSFEKSTAFINQYLTETVLPKYPDMTMFLREIYENLMLEFPDELDESNDMDDSVSLKSVESSSVKSYCSAEFSPLSLQAEKRTLRRIPSIVGDNASKKVIAVQVKKVNKNKKSASVSDDRVCKRTLFTQQPPTSDVLSTPKPVRRHSVSVIKNRVPDTPETKQINDMIWKKLERKRRHSNVNKKMVSIEESPLKELASPIKRHSSFYRSDSFNCHTSPRRFYTIKRHPSMIVGNHGFSKGVFTSVDSTKPVSASPLEVKLRRRSTLFSNFDEDNECEDLVAADNSAVFEDLENKVVPITYGDNELEQKTLGNDVTPVKRRQKRKSSKVEGQISKRLKLSPNHDKSLSSQEGRVIPAVELKSKKFTRFNSDLNTVSVIEKHDCEEPVFMSETTVDWLTEIEKDQSNTPTNFHDAFAKLANTPVNKQSPTIIKTSNNESITVSPCLSASSLELLEKAPIISPVITRKIKRGRSLNVEYD